MDTLKGLSMKLGQMMSYVDGTMPPDAQRVLRRLQRQSEPLAFDAVREAIEASLGAPLAELFESFEEEPFAAASIGQVHRARIDGADVAVKVQYPQIAKALEIDLGNVDRIGTHRNPRHRPFEREELFGELRERFMEECNYELEAANQRVFQKIWADDPRVIVPRTIASHCSRTVLTSSLQPGVGFYTFCDRGQR